MSLSDKKKDEPVISLSTGSREARDGASGASGCTRRPVTFWRECSPVRRTERVDVEVSGPVQGIVWAERLSRVVGVVGSCYDLSFALLYADTSDCFLSSLPPSSHRAPVLLRSYLANAISSCCLLPCTICIWWCDTISRVRYTSTSHSYDY